MEGDGKTTKDITSTDQQKSLPPLTPEDFDVMENTDFSTGYKCLKFLLTNRFMRDRLGPEEHDWVFKFYKS